MNPSAKDAKLKLRALRKKMGVLPIKNKVKPASQSRRLRKQINEGPVMPFEEAPKPQQGLTNNSNPLPGGSNAVVGPKGNPPTRKRKTEKSQTAKHCNKGTQTDEVHPEELEAVEEEIYPIFLI